MRNWILVGLFLCSAFSGIASGAEAFGPRESKLIFDESRGEGSYKIENTGKKMPWLVQVWVEDESEKKTSVISAVPMVFRVEPSSVFTVRLVKSGNIPADKETLFWAVSNSLPGGLPAKQEKQEGKVSATLDLAYRFKVPLIYRPAALSKVSAEPEKLEWRANDKGGLTLHNPTRFVMQLHHVAAGTTTYKGKGVSFLLTPMTSAEVKAGIKRGTRIKYGVVNDYGAVKEYEGIVK